MLSVVCLCLQQTNQADKCPINKKYFRKIKLKTCYLTGPDFLLFL